MVDYRKSADFELSSPAEFAQTPTADTDFTYTSRGIYNGGAAGDISVVMKAGGTVVFPAVPAGAVLPVAATRVNASGTTATISALRVLA